MWRLSSPSLSFFAILGFPALHPISSIFFCSSKNKKQKHCALWLKTRKKTRQDATHKHVKRKYDGKHLQLLLLRHDDMRRQRSNTVQKAVLVCPDERWNKEKEETPITKETREKCACRSGFVFFLFIGIRRRWKQCLEAWSVACGGVPCDEAPCGEGPCGRATSGSCACAMEEGPCRRACQRACQA